MINLNPNLNFNHPQPQINISNSTKSYSPNDFRNTFCSKHIQYSNYGQHDTVELLRTLLDDISKELNTNEIISKYK